MLERTTPRALLHSDRREAASWLATHLESPMDGLDRDDEELFGFVTQVVMSSEREPASRESIEINSLELERGLIDRQIAAAATNGGQALVDLQKREPSSTSGSSATAASDPAPSDRSGADGKR